MNFACKVKVSGFKRHYESFYISFLIIFYKDQGKAVQFFHLLKIINKLHYIAKVCLVLTESTCPTPPIHIYI